MASLIDQPKDLLLSTFEIAVLNLLYSFKDIENKTIRIRIHKDVNTIYWIIGHCLGHLYFYLEDFEDLKTDKKLQSLHDAQILHLTRYGAIKEEQSDENLLKFTELVDIFLYLSSKFRKYFQELPDDHLYKIFSKDGEQWYQMLQRISLHFMGHAGQISIIRRQIKEMNYSFVIGIQTCETRRKEWLEWWEVNKHNFSEV